jgi:tRNA-splicing ligase RtcB
MITSRDLLSIKFPEGKGFGLALKFGMNIAHDEKGEMLRAFKDMLATPESVDAEHELFEIAQTLIQPEDETIALVENAPKYKVYGADAIEEGATNQMEIAMKLPVTHSGALMPDAHQGYGLPIGGVLATNNAVIPYGVGVDIGCRMCLSIYELPPEMTETESSRLKKMLKHNSRFGRATFDRAMDHEVLARPEFNEIPVVKEMHKRAASQIGSSGGGNHFVEFGVVNVNEEENEFGVKPGNYLGLLSHSGSRGMGANIARHYTNLAMSLCKLPQEAKHLAWLDLDKSEGQEYWLAMNLAGDYASACHHQIHERMAVGLRTTPLAMIENHHNFAWKELDEKGNEIIVHRKGATPAGKGVLGIIPGSMTAPGFIVRGKGVSNSINSASHGAGRQMSRTKAKNILDKTAVDAYLKDHGVQVIGSGLDEAPQAYKDINEVMAYQSDLVDVLGTFTPKIVRMCGDAGYFEVD